MNPEELLPRIDERTRLILQRLDKINGKIEELDVRLREVEETTEKHKSYFKMVGSVIGGIVTAIAGVIFGR